MSVTEVTSTGWFGRIGNSIKGILFGIVLVLVALILLIWNERNAVQDIRANKEIGKEVVSISSDGVDPANEGKLVHLNGPAKTSDLVTNKPFGISENAIRLSWTAEIYQWVEKKDSKKKKKIGGGEETVTTYSYKQEWVKTPVDSSKFKEAGHQNSGQRKFNSGSSQAETVTLGDFKLASGMISQMNWSEPYAMAELPPEIKEQGVVQGGVFYTGQPGTPAIGDERVTFSITRPDDVSVMGVQTGDTFTAYKTKSGKTKLLLYQGILTAEQVVQGEKQKALFLRWILRAGGVLAMFFGFNLILRPLSVLADVLPFLGSLVGMAGSAISLMLSVGISFIVIAISWITFRPMLGIPLLILGAGCFVMIFMKLMKGRKQSSLTPPPPPPRAA